MSDLPERLSLREVGPRDGLQNEDAGADRHQGRAGRRAVARPASGGSRPCRSCTPRRSRRWPTPPRSGPRSQRNPDVRYSALVPNLRGAERALAAGFDEIEVVVSASDTHNRKNVNRSTEESLDDIAAILDLVHGQGATCQVIVSTAWGCPYEGDVPVERVLAVAGAGAGRRRRHPVVRRHHRHGDAVAGHPAGRGDPVRPSRTRR